MLKVNAMHLLRFTCFFFKPSLETLEGAPGSRSMGLYLQERGSRAWWHNASRTSDTPFPSCKPLETISRCACVSYIIDKRPYRSSCRYLTGSFPRAGPSLDHPVARFLYRDLSPMRGTRVIPRWPTPKLRYYRWTSTGNTIERSYLAIEKIEASLINRTSNHEIECVVRMDDFSECEREKHLGNLVTASCPARITPWCSPNGALTWRPHESKRCSTGRA